MSLNQKIILGGTIIIFVVGIGWALQYVSNNDLHLGKERGVMTSIITDEEKAPIQSRMKEKDSQLPTNQEVSGLGQSVSPTVAVENKAQVEQALAEIEGFFGEIEADMSVNE